MTTPGLTLAGFNATFPTDFPGVSSSLITTFINLINNGYNFTNNNVTDPTIINIYYWLCAHLVYTATNPITGSTAGGAGSYLPASQSAGLVSASFAQVQNLSLDQIFMFSSRYGQVFWTFAKQQYVQNFYISGGIW